MFITGYANTGKQFSTAFIKKLPLKTTTREKIKKVILQIKMHLPTTLISQWNFSTDQSKLTFQNLVMACLQLVYLYVTQSCLHTLMQPRLSANHSARTILIIL